MALIFKFLKLINWIYKMADQQIVSRISEEEMQEVYNWVDEIPLSRPKKNIARDFSDAGKSLFLFGTLFAIGFYSLNSWSGEALPASAGRPA